MLSRFRLQLPRLRRGLRRRRRLLALALAALLAAMMLPPLAAALAPPARIGTEVVVAAEDLAPGTTLQPSDLTTLRVAEELVPEAAAADASLLDGRVLSTAVPAGTVLLPGMLRDQSDAAPPEGAVLMLVPVPAALAEHLSPGTRIELLLPVGADGDTRAREVLATVTHIAQGDATDSPVTPLTSSDSLDVIVAVDRDASGQLAEALGTSTVSVAVIG